MFLDAPLAKQSNKKPRLTATGFVGRLGIYFTEKISPFFMVISANHLR